MKLKVQIHYHKYEVSKVTLSEVFKVDRRASIKRSNKIWKNAEGFTLLLFTIKNI